MWSWTTQWIFHCHCHSVCASLCHMRHHYRHQIRFCAWHVYDKDNACCLIQFDSCFSHSITNSERHCGYHKPTQIEQFPTLKPTQNEHLFHLPPDICCAQAASAQQNNNRSLSHWMSVWCLVYTHLLWIHRHETRKFHFSSEQFESSASKHLVWPITLVHCYTSGNGSEVALLWRHTCPPENFVIMSVNNNKHLALPSSSFGYFRRPKIQSKWIRRYYNILNYVSDTQRT